MRIKMVTLVISVLLLLSACGDQTLEEAVSVPTTVGTASIEQGPPPDITPESIETAHQTIEPTSTPDAVVATADAWMNRFDFDDMESKCADLGCNLNEMYEDYYELTLELAFNNAVDLKNLTPIVLNFMIENEREGESIYYWGFDVSPTGEQSSDDGMPKPFANGGSVFNTGTENPLFIQNTAAGDVQEDVVGKNGNPFRVVRNKSGEPVRFVDALTLQESNGIEPTKVIANEGSDSTFFISNDSIVSVMRDDGVWRLPESTIIYIQSGEWSLEDVETIDAGMSVFLVNSLGERSLQNVGDDWMEVVNYDGLSYQEVMAMDIQMKELPLILEDGSWDSSINNEDYTYDIDPDSGLVSAMYYEGRLVGRSYVDANGKEELAVVTDRISNSSVFSSIQFESRIFNTKASYIVSLNTDAGRVVNSRYFNDSTTPRISRLKEYGYLDDGVDSMGAADSVALVVRAALELSEEYEHLKDQLGDYDLIIRYDASGNSLSVDSDKKTIVVTSSFLYASEATIEGEPSNPPELLRNLQNSLSAGLRIGENTGIPDDDNIFYILGCLPNTKTLTVIEPPINVTPYDLSK